MHLYKYASVDEARREVVEGFRQFVVGHVSLFPPSSGSAVIAVPMSFLRLALRGFNQADDLAAAFSEAVGMPLAAPLTRRFRWRRQAQIDDPNSRQRNARGSFSVIRGAHLPAHVVLVDDVATTSATLAAAASALKSAGAQSVTAVTFLRG
jgi:predicted amidophosphoribosyltransferase